MKNSFLRITMAGIVLVTAMAASFGLPAKDTDVTINFNRDIRPILSSKCFSCHGPANQEAGLRLDSFDAATGKGDNGQAIAPHSPDKSLLIDRIYAIDDDELMPPPESNKTLDASEKLLLKQWIAQGSQYQKHWSFNKIGAIVLPRVKNSSWSSHPVDRFVLARLEAEQLSPEKEADKRTLIRRLSFDLTGLPPSIKEIRDFVNDESLDAYDKVVNRLLASPHYGEHMAKYWLDLVRFGDTDGLMVDPYRQMYPYRDWVIRSFNDNLPFDQFVVDNIAGDLHQEASQDQLIASGFNRLHVTIQKGSAIPEESYTRNVTDRVNAVGTAFLGLTVGCAACHDHKFDPVSQKEYYQLFAFFNNIDGKPQSMDPVLTMTPHAPIMLVYRDDNHKKEVAAKLETLDKQLAELEANKDKAIIKQIAQLNAEKASLLQDVPHTLIMKEREKARPSYVLERGVYSEFGEQVARSTPAFLPPWDKSLPQDRMGLAQWLVDENHPLTSRVTVNRFWQQVFGVGLVKTSEDFGTQGEWPSHPELLDFLAYQFIQSNWNVKKLMKLIVTSNTYKQSSHISSRKLAMDPENRLLSRGPRVRLEAEMLRDQALAVSGLLVPRLYGPSVKPPQPAGLWKAVSVQESNTKEFKADQGEDIYRRSLYTFWKRTSPPPQMALFDAPSREFCVARRERSNTPTQALVLMNEGQYFAAARKLARKACFTEKLSDEDKLIFIYQSITSQVPDQAEQAILLVSLEKFKQHYSRNKELAQALNQESKTEPQVSQQDLSAWIMVSHIIFNLDIAKNKD